VWERRSKADFVALRLITRIRRRKLAMRADCWHNVERDLPSTSPLTCSAIQVTSKLFMVDTLAAKVLYVVSKHLS
jgi:hypothetical protein